jgi:predicted MFS family arabinose efflux permease
LLPFAAVVALGTTALYLASTVLLLDALPAARGAVMALQTGTFEAGWALGTAAMGGLLILPLGYRAIFPFSGLALLASLACVALSASGRRSRVCASTMLRWKVRIRHP